MNTFFLRVHGPDSEAMVRPRSVARVVKCFAGHDIDLGEEMIIVDMGEDWVGWDGCEPTLVGKRTLGG